MESDNIAILLVNSPPKNSKTENDKLRINAVKIFFSVFIQITSTLYNYTILYLIIKDM